METKETLITLWGDSATQNADNNIIENKSVEDDDFKLSSYHTFIIKATYSYYGKDIYSTSLFLKSVLKGAIPQRWQHLTIEELISELIRHEKEWKYVHVPEGFLYKNIIKKINESSSDLVG